MALAKDRIISTETCAYNLKSNGGDFPSLQPYNSEETNNNNSNKLKNSSMVTYSTTSPSLGSPSSANSNNEFVFQAARNNQTEEVHSLINFRGGFTNQCNGSLLSFNNKDHHDNQFTNWDGNANYSYQVNPKCSGSDPRLVEDFNCFQTASNFSSTTISPGNENIGNWLYAEDQADCIQECRVQDAPPSHKRSSMVQEENITSGKKQCTTASRKAKAKSSSSSSSATKDPQSIAAKVRRERISERLKTLQDLVPNGSKVDLVTMLEKAISYVKFLQLQVKVLATDEFWPVQGGKAPDISQVKEAIDAILSSHKDRNSSSSLNQ